MARDRMRSREPGRPGGALTDGHDSHNHSHSNAKTRNRCRLSVTEDESLDAQKQGYLSTATATVAHYNEPPTPSLGSSSSSSSSSSSRERGEAKEAHSREEELGDKSGNLTLLGRSSDGSALFAWGGGGGKYETCTRGRCMGSFARPISCRVRLTTLDFEAQRAPPGSPFRSPDVVLIHACVRNVVMGGVNWLRSLRGTGARVVCLPGSSPGEHGSATSGAVPRPWE